MGDWFLYFKLHHVFLENSEESWLDPETSGTDISYHIHNIINVKFNETQIDEQVCFYWITQLSNWNQLPTH